MLRKIILFIIIIIPIGGVFLINNTSLSANLTPEADYSFNSSEENERMEDFKDFENEEGLDESQKEIVDEKEPDNSCLKEVNKLNEEELQLISGVGQVYSERIVKEEIKNIEDLKSVDGIGEVTAEKIKDFVCNLEDNLPDKKKEEENEEASTNGSVESGVNEVTLSEEELEMIFTAVRASERNLDEEEGVSMEEESSDSYHNGSKKNIDINNSTKEELKSLSGIGSAYAENIIEKRPFCSPEDLLEVSGIGEKTLNNIKDQEIAEINCDQEVEMETLKAENENDNQELKEEIKRLEKEIENTLDEKENLKDEIDNLERQIDDLENEKRNLRNTISETRSNNNDLEKEVEKLKIERDLCRFESQPNINKASSSRLKEVSGIGDSIAEDIEKYVEESPILHLEELKSIDGVGEVTVNNIISDGFCAEDPVENGEDDSEGESGSGEDGEDDGNGNGDEEKQLITFQKESVESVEIKIYNKDEETTDTLDIDDDGKTSKELTSGEYKLKTKDGVLIKSFKIEGGNEEDISFALPKDFKVTFQEKNELESAEVTIYEDEDLDNQTGDVLELDKNGVVEKDLQEGNYSFKANLQGYESYENEFELDEDKTIEFELEEVKNMLKNPYFEEWSEEEKPKYWIGSHSFSNNWFKNSNPAKGDYSIKVDSSTDGERELDQHIHQLEEGEKYYGKLLVKGEGGSEAKLAIKEQKQTYEYSERVSLTEGEWKTISVTKTASGHDEDEEGVRITTKEDDESEIYIGAAWLSTEKPPENWPK